MRTKGHCEDDQMTVWDPKCKYLHPSESTEASSSNEGMPQKFDTLSEADIMADFSRWYANTRGENEHFECYWAHGSITYWSCRGNVMHEKACHDHTSWCILFDITSDGATLYHDSTLMTSLYQIRQRRKALHSFTGRYGSRWTFVHNLPNPVRTLAILHYQLKN